MGKVQVERKREGDKKKKRLSVRYLSKQSGSESGRLWIVSWYGREDEWFPGNPGAAP